MRAPKPLAIVIVGVTLVAALVACSSPAPSAPSKAPAGGTSSQPAATAAPVASSQQGTKKSDYPNKPIEMIVSYAAGGGQDVAFRIVAKYAEKHMGAPIAVVNKVGGGGVVGNTEIAKSKPDGYTLGTVHSGIVYDDLVIKGVPYTTKDFLPIVQVAADPHVIVVKNDLKMDLKKFVEYAKQAPEKASMAMGGTWTSHDFAKLKLEQAAGIKFLALPFQGGAPATQAVAKGDADASTPFVVEALPSVEAKTVTPVAVTSLERVPQLKDVPTLKELGFDVAQEMWRCVSVPPNTPPEIVDHLEGVFTKTYNDPAFQEDMKKAGIFPVFKSRKDLGSYVEQERDRYQKLIKSLGVVPQ